MKQYVRTIILSFFLLFSFQAVAQSSPIVMLEKTTDQMLSALNSSSKDTKTLYSLVQRILLPHVDLNVMSQQILGNYWKNASSAQRAAFKQQFSYFVTRTYSTALTSYSNEKVKYFPIRGGVKGKRVQVNSSIIQGNGQNIAVNYRLLQAGSQWKVYDFSVEGVSIVSNYRSQFSSTLRNKGLDGLIAQLKSHNASIN